MTTSSFREAYSTLQKNAEKLRNQREPDLDNLLEVVTQSVAAYKVCKSRIEAVEQALEQALSNAGLGQVDTEAGVRATDPESTPRPFNTGSSESDDDVPF